MPSALVHPSTAWKYSSVLSIMRICKAKLEEKDESPWRQERVDQSQKVMRAAVMSACLPRSSLMVQEGTKSWQDHA